MTVPLALRYPGHVSAYPEVADDVVAELCPVLFSSLRRSDQRRKAEQYLLGLLSVEGRKSMRNIATLVGGQAAEQSLHHFISSSTWEWLPIRKALAHFLERAQPPQAWVVQSLSIPKAGRHSVGVERQFVPELGLTMNGQQAYGVWFASEEASAPVSWRLFLPDTWVNDRSRRRRGEIPDSVGEESLEECAVATVLHSVYGWGVKQRPVVLDARATGFQGLARRFADAGVPLLAQVGRSMRLAVADPALPGHGRGVIPAQRILESVKGLRRSVECVDLATGVPGTSLVVGIRVVLPQGPVRLRIPGQGIGDRVLILLGEWHDPRRAPARIWLTDMTSVSSSSLLRMTMLTRRVARDFTEVGDLVGLRDFVGRSFQGWHRHMTLASVAHTASMLGNVG